MEVLAGHRQASSAAMSRTMDTMEIFCRADFDLAKGRPVI
jgi:hypothetical protein